MVQQSQSSRAIHTGYPTLDEQLPGQGWPDGGLIEFLLASTGVGELRVLLPALVALSQSENRWIAWINPPFTPYAPALEAAGVDISKILLVHPRNHKEALWAAERACKSASCSSVLAWLNEKPLKLKDTQRLQVAARQGRTFTCLFRPEAMTNQPSMAELRMTARPAGSSGRVVLDIIKRRGGWPVTDLELPIAERTNTQYRTPRDIQEQLELWRSRHPAPACDDPGPDPVPLHLPAHRERQAAHNVH